MEKSRIEAFGHSLSRRAVMIGGSVAAASAVLVLGIASRRRAPASKAFIKELDFSETRSLGDGYYEASGWVLTKSDLEMAGAPVPEDAPDVR